MTRLKIFVLFIFSVFDISSQNDIDAMRYSRSGVGGSSRFIAMGGAFGALGADPGCAAFNPAGLGIFRKGEISFGGSIRLSNNTAKIYNRSASASDVKFAFNNFGFAGAWADEKDSESRHVIAFTNSQLQNYNSVVTMTGSTRSSSILKDMKNLAELDGGTDYLNNSYEGLAYETYLLDYDGDQFISLVDLKRTVSQSREIVTSGRLNELNFSYAYAYKDKFYFGGSLGVPRVQYESTTTHSEADSKDSMRVVYRPGTNTYDDTYIDGIPSLDSAYKLLQGFNSLIYSEYFKTQGSGINLKLGGIARLGDIVRVGIYYHTPTIYFLNDTYYSSISASFDRTPTSPIESKNPPEGGYFEYKLITPARYSLNSAFIIKKMAVIGLDYELVNYAAAKLLSTKSSDFADANATIKNKYKAGHNIRLGAELNIKPVMFRAGYAMMGSPFGDVFSGDFVRHTVSLGVGYRPGTKWYFDLFWAKTFTTEEYYLFGTLDVKARVNYGSASLGATVGYKF